MTSKPSPRVWVIVIALAVAAAALAARWWFFGNHYPVTSTPMVFAARFEGHLIYWLDNERFLVPGWERPADVPEGQEAGKKFPPVGLYIWNTRTHTATRHSDLGKQYSLCYNDGFIVYTFFDDGKVRRNRQGQFGHEEEVPQGGPVASTTLATIFMPVRCENVPRSRDRNT